MKLGTNIRFNTGEVFCPLALFAGEPLNYNYTIFEEGQVITEFVLNNTRDALELVETNISTEIFEIPFSDGSTTRRVRRSFPDNPEKIVFNKETLEIFVSDEFFKKFTAQSASKEDCAVLFSEVCSVVNPFVYNVLTTTPKLKLRDVSMTNIVAFNLIRHIDSIVVLEKTIKKMGTDWFFLNIQNENFNLDTTKRKVTQILEIPVAAGDMIKKLKLTEMFEVFQRLAAIDPNYLTSLLEYLVCLNKITKKQNVKVLETTRLVEVLIKLLSFKDMGFSMVSLLNYLIKQSAISNKNSNYYSCPMNPFRMGEEMIDYLRFALSIKDCKFDKYPDSLELAFYTLRRNNSILENPREEEFSMAIAAYKHLEFNSKKYMFRAPIDERDLFNEGNQLEHCVATYRDSIIDEGVVVMFMRSLETPQKSFVTIECCDGVLVQAKTHLNTEVDDPQIFAEISKWLYAIERKQNER